MKERFAQLTLQRKLALLAFLLGLVALFVGSPYQGNRAVVDAKALAIDIGSESDHITATELADWLIAERADFRLIDLRDEQEYAEYHIPTAENVVVASLTDYPLMRNEKILLYSNGGIHASQAAILLRAQKYKAVYTLLGGLNAWKDEVLFPSLPADATPDQMAHFEKMKQVARHFGGAAQTGVGEAKVETPSVLPKLEMPTQTQPMPRKQKAREGC